MSATVLVAAILLGGDGEPIALDEPQGTTHQTFFSAETLFAAALRGQDPGGYEPDSLGAGVPDANWAPPQGNVFGDPFAPPPAPDGSNYFLDPSLSFGAVGPQPYRFGWSSRYDVGFLPSEGVRGGGAQGAFGIFEFNSAWRYTTGWPATFPQTIFSVTPEFNYRSWSGPSDPHLPANVFRFAGDFELASPGNNPISYQLGFNPAFVSDLQATPNADSFNWDARGVVFVRASPQWMVAIGAAYWDRVDNIVIPYAGVVWTPNDYWEFRLLFPKSRISYFLGSWWGSAAWVYGGVEYNVEAYQINLTSPGGRDERIQIADYRALFGLRTEGQGVTGFLEAGFVFARDVEFQHGTPGFDINSGFIGRLGLRY